MEIKNDILIKTTTHLLEIAKVFKKEYNDPLYIVHYDGFNEHEEYFYLKDFEDVRKLKMDFVASGGYAININDYMDKR